MKIVDSLKMASTSSGHSTLIRPMIAKIWKTFITTMITIPSGSMQKHAIFIEIVVQKRCQLWVLYIWCLYMYKNVYIYLYRMVYKSRTI